MQADAIAAAFQDALAAAGHALTYTRGAQSVALTALRGKSQRETDEEGAVLVTQTVDYLLCAADLDTLAPPAIGDTIRDTATGRDYQVYSPAGLDHFDWMDPDETLLRVHTRRV